jgi:Uma2 family endonuclease
MEVALGLGLPCTPAGQTTFRREEKRGGGEGDKSFYLAHAEAIVGQDDLDLQVVPPPDLVIEAVNTRGPDRAIEVWKRLGVPEVWTDDGEEVRFLVLGPTGEYAAAEHSRAFPGLRPVDVADWSHRPPNEVGTDWVRALRRWVEEELVPRVRKD